MQVLQRLLPVTRQGNHIQGIAPLYDPQYVENSGGRVGKDGQSGAVGGEGAQIICRLALEKRNLIIAFNFQQAIFSLVKYRWRYYGPLITGNFGKRILIHRSLYPMFKGGNHVRLIH